MPHPQDARRLRWLARWSKLRGTSTIEAIEDAVRRLSPKERAALRAWFAQLEAAAWDRQIEEDIAAGRLEALAGEALNDLRQGCCLDAVTVLRGLVRGANIKIDAGATRGFPD